MSQLRALVAMPLAGQRVGAAAEASCSDFAAALISPNSDEGGEHASRICAIYLLDLVAYVRVQLICMETALTSMPPVRADGMRAAI